MGEEWRRRAARFESLSGHPSSFHALSRRTSRTSRLGPAEPLVSTHYPCSLSGASPSIKDMGDDWLWSSVPRSLRASRTKEEEGSNCP